MGRIMQSLALLVRISSISFYSHIPMSPSSHRIATASYRLLPLVILNPAKPIPPHLAEKFQRCFSPGVIYVDPVTKQVSVDAKNMRNEAMTREVLRHPEFEDCVRLARVRDHFICVYLIGHCGLTCFTNGSPHLTQLKLSRKVLMHPRSYP
jgi:hypothetical protein